METGAATIVLVVVVAILVDVVTVVAVAVAAACKYCPRLGRCSCLFEVLHPSCY